MIKQPDNGIPRKFSILQLLENTSVICKIELVSNLKYTNRLFIFKKLLFHFQTVKVTKLFRNKPHITGLQRS